MFAVNLKQTFFQCPNAIFAGMIIRFFPYLWWFFPSTFFSQLFPSTFPLQDDDSTIQKSDDAQKRRDLAGVSTVSRWREQLATVKGPLEMTDDVDETSRTAPGSDTSLGRREDILLA